MNSVELGNVYVPSALEEAQATEGYIRYLSGVTFLHAPEETVHIHRREIEVEPAAFVLDAENLMINGIKKVIEFANHPDHRTPQVRMEENYDEASFHMSRTVSRVNEHEYSRVALLCPAVKLLRPAPMLDKQIYKYVCHSRLGKLTTLGLMDGVLPSSDLSKFLENKRPLMPSQS